ncbi:MAG: adenosylmethionine--8-amino-7-oxononanoate transaminase [Solirubrobacterales bacterium]|nr:adenosylmethionine--8-amino-7-oxononanoate transaminase [Solirubrobacterales bacterium]
MNTDHLRELDRTHVWHPFTQQQGWEADEPPLIIERGEGVRLFDTDGNSYLDGVSSLWCTVHGHQREEIDQAVREQLGRVAHSTMLGLSHPGAIQLAAKLSAIAPEGLSRVFYSDSGSTAVEIALKMAFQFHAQNGQPERTQFVKMRDAYHGDTIGSVSVGGMDLFHQTYRPLLFETLEVTAGDTDALERLLEAEGPTVSAVILEPLVQGAAGMLMHDVSYLNDVRRLCDRHGILLIADEVATGFGRTGKMFACEHAGISPDLMCVAKGLTGGYLPLAATLATEEIYQGFLGAQTEYRTFFHGHTYTGNPLACAAAIANLDIFEREQTVARAQQLGVTFGDLLEQQIKPLPHVAEIRHLGMMCGIELDCCPPERRTGHLVTLAARLGGAIIRPLGDVIVLMPPLGITERELAELVQLTAAAIADASLEDAPVRLKASLASDAAGTGASATEIP